jgi:NAD(P)H-dependent flavin oxidoreductase YrpB (nitropropane dioxygenase family)
VHANGALASWQVGSLAEAVAAERAGCDFVIAQGTEAGGHVRGQTSALPLLAQVADALRVPVLAAGGIATARDLAAVLAAGASGARLGTRFAACAESGAHRDYVKALLGATAADTCLTEVFGEQWPNAPHRVLRSAVAAAQAADDPIVGRLALGGATVPIPRFSPLVPSTDTTGNVAAMALYAGESVTHVTAVEPAATIVAQLVAGAERRLRELTDRRDDACRRPPSSAPCSRCSRSRSPSGSTCTRSGSRSSRAWIRTSCSRPPSSPSCRRPPWRIRPTT